MSPRILLAAALTAGALSTLAAPAHATFVCAEVYTTKEPPVVCVPWGSPLPHLAPQCPVSQPDLVTVCERY